MKLSSPIGRLRLTGILEGISFLVLLGIAMPLKYMAGMPLAVKYVGWAHGLLFILYLAAVFDVFTDRKWPVGRAVLAVIASILPFGTFILDKSLRKEENRSIT